MEPVATKRVLGPQLFDMEIPLEGLDLSRPKRDIDHRFLSDATGARIRRGLIVPSHGRTQVGSTLDGGVQLITHLRKYTNLTSALVLTTQNLYKWSASDWSKVQETYTTGTVGVTNGSPTVTGSETLWDENAGVGDVFLRTGDEDSYTIQEVVSDTEITLTENYVGVTGSGANYTITRDLQGDLDHPASQCFGQNTLLLNNQVDYIKKYDGTTLGTLAGASGYQTSDYHRAMVVRYYADSVILIAPVEDGNEVWQRVRWSDVGELENWTSTGFYDLVDSPGALMNGLPLGSVFALYKKDSIIYMNPVGATYGFSFTDEHSGVGLSAQNSLINVGEGHFFLGEAAGHGYDVFINQGTQITSIGKGIREVLQSLLSRDNVDRCWSVYDPITNSVLLFTPTLESSVPNRVWIYEIGSNDILSGKWMLENIRASGGGVAYQSNTTAYEDLVGSYQDQDWQYGTSGLGADAEMGHIGNDSGKVLKIDPTSVVDQDGSAIRQMVQSKAVNYKDIGAKHGTMLRCIGAEVIARGGSVNVYYSTDEGRTWTLGKAVTLTSQMDKYQIDFDATGHTITIKLENNSTAGKFYLERWFIRLQERGRH